MSGRPSAAPPSVPEDAYCEKHLAPPLLFCEDDQATLCDKCYLTQEHRDHTVLGVQEAAENYRVGVPGRARPSRRSRSFAGSSGRQVT